MMSQAEAARAAATGDKLSLRRTTGDSHISKAGPAAMRYAGCTQQESSSKVVALQKSLHSKYFMFQGYRSADTSVSIMAGSNRCMLHAACTSQVNLVLLFCLLLQVAQLPEP
jgi:hypothetical protein